MLEGSLTMRASMPRFSMARRVRSTRAANSARLKCNVGVMLGGTGSCRGTTGREAGRGAICGGSLGEPGAALEGTSRRARGESAAATFVFFPQPGRFVRGILWLRRDLPRDQSLPLPADPGDTLGRSEEQTSELQSLMRISYAVFCLKKKKATIS